MRQSVSSDAGTLSSGANADICIFNPDEEWVVDAQQFFSKSRNCPWHGHTLKGKVKATYVGGKQVFDGTRSRLKTTCPFNTTGAQAHRYSRVQDARRTAGIICNHMPEVQQLGIEALISGVILLIIACSAMLWIKPAWRRAKMPSANLSGMADRLDQFLIFVCAIIVLIFFCRS